MAGAPRLRRGLAQQPSLLPALRAPGLLLVGDRSHLLRAALARGARTRLGPTAGAPRRAGGEMKIAIVGSGIAGNVAAWHLHREGHEITLFEAASHIGGHTHTHAIDGLAVDTGFIVF